MPMLSISSACRATRSRTASACTVLVAVLTLSACATHGDIQSRTPPVDPQSLGLTAQPPAEVSAEPERWWAGQGDATLRQLIEQALQGNPSMQVAAGRWQRVQAQLMAVEGRDEPTLQASAEVDRQRYTAHGLVPPPIAGSTRTLGTLQLAGNWELDLFGRQRAEIDAAIGQSRAATADLQATRLLLSTQVARTYVQLGRLQGLRAVMARQLAQREEMLSLIRQRVQSGLDTQVELRQGEGALPETRVQLEALDEQVTLTRHALAVLTGQDPRALDSLQVALDQVSLQPVGKEVPIDLLARRADVMAARWRVEASGYEVDAARALFYPNVNVASYAGYNAIGLDRLLKPGSWQWGLMPAIHLPLFDGQQRRANLRGKVAEQDTAVATYNQTVLQAVQDVADQLSSTQSTLRQQQEQQRARQSTEAAYDLALQRYRAGLGSYLVVLNAEAGVLQQRRQTVELQARALDVQLGLYRALGGQLQAPVPPSPLTPSTTSGDRS